MTDRWNTSPEETPDLTAHLTRSDLAVLAAGHPLDLEAWSPDDPHGMPAAVVRLELTDGAADEDHRAGLLLLLDLVTADLTRTRHTTDAYDPQGRAARIARLEVIAARLNRELGA